ncbi:potassium-transporting ATPase subunit KdpC [Brevundimonas diminuta]|uniref:potassium-transporting ATPase subunit KdpC n=1 Tax=Brevundimonas diminuta TaxID=293 RepID=UPI00190376D3|nr:potassium-transporting ATPase subunit KdpC [Brevundimonas diminuta]MBK1975738.1 potassium-transporting ATPase subunit KdpC [Brevundimonas diminuta]
MLNHIRPAIVMIALFTGVLGVGYPLAVTGVAQAAFSDQANGSLVRDKEGQVVGSALVGQAFAAPGYLHSRPSAAGDGYDAAASSGSNLGPLNPDLIARVKTDADALQSETGARAIPADAVTASASGLDPHISPAHAELQAARIAKARGVGEAQVREVIRQHVEDRTFGVLGQPRVNVLLTNQALDARLGLLTTEGG